MNQDITPQSSNQAPQGFGASVAPTPAADAPQEQPTGQVIPLQSGPKKSKLKTFALVLLFLLLLGAVAGAYLYQQGKIDDVATAKTTADKQVVALQTQLKAAQTKVAATPKTTAPVVSYDIVTGTASSSTTGTASLAGLYKPGTVVELWVEYGTAPDALNVATTHITKGLGEGDAKNYSTQNFTVSGLKSGQNYFYRVAAKNKTTTVYGGVASFTSAK
jgi:outer membrane murein-binding lipoprotein Lpp